MVEKSHKNTKNKIDKILFTKKISLLILSFVIAISAIFTMVNNHKVASQQVSSTPLNVPPPTPAPHVTFTSDNLGVSFSYLTRVAGRVNFYTKEIGNTIYLYYNPEANQPFLGTDAEFLSKISPGHGYSLEVFNKDEHKSLIDAIKEQFLDGYKASDCIVKQTRYGHRKNDESIQTAVIVANISPNSQKTRLELDESIAKCPKYTTTFGVSYFMMDPKHPNKFLFIQLGQDNIPSGIVGSSWDETIKIF